MDKQLLTINESLKRAKAEGLPIGESYLRRLIKTNTVPHVMTGKVALIYYPTLREYITCGAIPANPSITPAQPLEGINHETN